MIIHEGQYGQYGIVDSELDLRRIFDYEREVVKVYNSRMQSEFGVHNAYISRTILAAKYWSRFEDEAPKDDKYFGRELSKHSFLYKIKDGKVTRAVPFVVKEDFFDKDKTLILLLDGTDMHYLSHHSMEDTVREFRELFDEWGIKAEEAPYTNPVILPPEEPDLRTWIKEKCHSNLKPHFFGKKSKAVEWKYWDSNWRPQILATVSQLVSYFGYEWTQKHKEANGDVPAAWDFYYEAATSGCGLLFAFDHERGMPVCGVLMHPRTVAYKEDRYAYTPTRKNGFFAGSMLRSLEDEYRPYSLAVACHVAMVGAVFYGLGHSWHERSHFLELGVNLDSKGDYKKVYDTEEYRPQVLSSIPENKMREVVHCLDKAGVWKK